MGIGLGFVLGGALQGVGSGLLQQQIEKDKARRDEALSRLRQQESAESYRLQGVNQAAHDERSADAQMARQNDSQTFQLAVGEASAQAAAAERQADREYQERKDERERQWKAQQDAIDRAFRSNEAAKERLSREKLEYGEPVDSFTNEQTGDVTMVYRGGKTSVYQGVARKMPRASDAGQSYFGASATAPQGGAATPTRKVVTDENGNLRWEN